MFATQLITSRAADPLERERSETTAQSRGAIGILAPIELAAFRDFLPADTPEQLYRRIAGATPVNFLCRELLDRGHRLAVFSLHPSMEGELALRGDRLQVYLGPVKPTSVLCGFRDERQFLVRAMRRERLLCVHAHWTYEYALAAADSGLPHVVTAHDAPLNCLRYNLLSDPTCLLDPRRLKQAVRGNAFWVARTCIAYRAVRRAKRIVAVSPHVANHLRRFRFYREPIEVVPNGMPRMYFAPRLRSQPDHAFTFATALGNWGQLKNPTAAIAAFAKVREVMPNARMLMFGAGYAEAGPAAAWSRQRGWHLGIEFRGQTPHAEVMELLSEQVDVLVHPSLEEAHPMPLIEAMTFGIPVVAGEASGGVPWTLGHGACGILVDVRSADAIAAGMLQLARDDELRGRLGRAAREQVQQRFRVDQMADRYEEVYATLISETPTAA